MKRLKLEQCEDPIL